MCEVTQKKEWKRNRNLYAILMLDQLLNNRIEAPFTKLIAEEEPLPFLQRAVVFSKITKQFRIFYKQQLVSKLGYQDNMVVNDLKRNTKASPIIQEISDGSNKEEIFKLREEITELKDLVRVFE